MTEMLINNPHEIQISHFINHFVMSHSLLQPISFLHAFTGKVSQFIASHDFSLSRFIGSKAFKVMAIAFCFLCGSLSAVAQQDSAVYNAQDSTTAEYIVQEDSVDYPAAESGYHGHAEQVCGNGSLVGLLILLLAIPAL